MKDLNPNYFVIKMFAQNLKNTDKMHAAAKAPQRLCVGYWFGFSSTETMLGNEQDPIKMASSYKGSGNK